MRFRDFALLVFVCLIWGFSNVLSKIVVGTWHVPPLFFTAARFAIVLTVTLPWLRPLPRPIWRIMLVGVLMGGGNFAFLFMGLRSASPSSAAVVLQAGVPITTLLSVLILGERIRWRRGVGITLTLAGVLLVVWRPGFAVSSGLALVFAASFLGSLGAVLMKQMDDVAPLRFQAWVGLTGAVPLGIASGWFESGQMQTVSAIGWPFVAALLFSALVVSVGAHSVYYWLIARYEATLLAPLTLMTPLTTIALGVLITGDHLDARMIAGAALALIGVLVVAVRPSRAPIVQAQEHG